MRLGTGTGVAPFWHPIRPAGEAAMTDIITGGRLDLGIARGAYGFEYERLSPGLDAWTAGQKMRELIPVAKALWAGDHAHEGEHWQFLATTSAPQPVQQPHSPIWMAARDPNSHDFAVANGCKVQVTPMNEGHEALGYDEFSLWIDIGVSFERKRASAGVSSAMSCPPSPDAWNASSITSTDAARTGRGPSRVSTRQQASPGR